MKRVITLALSIIMIMSFGTTAFAEESINSNKSVLDECCRIQTSEEDRNQQFENAMEQILSELDEESGERGPKYHYRYEYYPYQYRTVGGYAGNQVAGGYRFPTGGGFWYTDSGGPSVSGSISLSLPAPYNFVSFSVNLGRKSSSGQFVTVPNTTDYFKLYISKVIEVRPYAIYIARSGTQNWELYMVGGVPITYSITAYAKKV